MRSIVQLQKLDSETKLLIEKQQGQNYYRIYAKFKSVGWRLNSRYRESRIDLIIWSWQFPKWMVEMEHICISFWLILKSRYILLLGGIQKGCTICFQSFTSKAVENIGPYNIIQLISDRASDFLTTRNKLTSKYLNIFKINSTAHCIKCSRNLIHLNIFPLYLRNTKTNF